MNNESQLQQINMGYRFKHIAIGIVTYIVVKYAWKLYQTKSEE